MGFGDRVRIEMLDDAGASIFGAIEQKVVEAATPTTASTTCDARKITATAMDMWITRCQRVLAHTHCATTTALSLRNPMVDPTRTFEIRLAIRCDRKTRGFHILVQKGGARSHAPPKGLRPLSFYGVSRSLSVVA